MRSGFICQRDAGPADTENNESTGGNVQTGVEVNGKLVFVGLNAYIKK